jgi:hypothetical protein
MLTAVVGIVGILATVAAALGTKWLDFHQQDRQFLRHERLEAHHAFLNQINRVIGAIGAIDRARPANPTVELLARLEAVLGDTVNAFNRVELVGTQTTYDLAVAMMTTVDTDRVLKGEFQDVMRDIGEASREYREAVKKELGD